MTNVNCNSCDYCNYCNSCDSCNYCDSCNSCDYCNSCNSCGYCNSCNSCNSCDSCDSCNYCNYCKNLKMTEYNYFCRSKAYNDENLFQQKRYRIFNVEVWQEQYRKVARIYHKLEFDKSGSYSTRFQTAFKKMWDTLTKEQKQEYYEIPHFNREWFTFITWVEKEPERELTPYELFKSKWRTKQAFEEIIQSIAQK